MTAQKHFKQLIRARMEKTGERYAAARRQILRTEEPAPRYPQAASHFPGNVPATTALRVLLTDAGVRASHTGAPFSEAMLFGIAGGIGIGIFSFFYEKANFASFFISGRHQWHDDLVYLSDALRAFKIKPLVRETSGVKAASKHLVEAVAGNRPCIAWVDMYHVITVYEVDERNGTALIGDLSDHPVKRPLAELEASRGRVKKQKFRLLSIAPEALPATDLRTLVEDGLRRCHQVFVNPTLPSAKGNGKLEVLETWAGRLRNPKDSQSWGKMFQPGPNLWRGLTSVHDYVEHFRTGGGLCRPLFADFLEEAEQALKWPALKDLGGRYRELGRQWSELADAALPDRVAEFRKAKELRWQLQEQKHGGASAEEVQATTAEIESHNKEVSGAFPLSGQACTELFADLGRQVQSLYEGETTALGELGKLVKK